MSPARRNSSPLTSSGVVVAVLVAVVAVGAVWLVASTPDDDTAASSSESVAHVHGLGVDPADGLLQVATHHGLFELSGDGTASRVSEDRHDFMGFTVAGTDRFLASGHPSPGTAAFRELDQPLFGLIESTDGGRTWQPVSLSGEVDFHALEAAHDQVYGFDATSGRFMVSTDGSDWEIRSTVSIGDLAVDPADADHIVASSADGLLESVDGGGTWGQLDGAPPAVFLDWHADRGLWGLDGQGRVHHRDGDSWRTAGSLGGSPQALLVHDDGVFAAVDDGSTAIHRSTDGQDWNVIFRDAAEE